MTTINQLSSVDSVSSADQIPVYITQNGSTRKASLSVLATLLQTLLSLGDDKVTEYSAPSATGFTVTLADNNTSRWLVLTPTAGFAAGTIKLPALTNCIDKQEILVNCTQAVTTLTIDGNGSTVTGGPTTLAANGFFRLRFDDVTDTWYRVG